MKSMLSAMAFLCLLITFQPGLKAQSFFKGIQVGIGGSTSIKNQPSEIKSVINYSPILSFQANLVLGMDFNKFGLTVEPGFIRKGLKTRYKLNTPVQENSKTNYNFIQLPILGQYNFNKKTSLSLGPEFYYLLKAWRVENHISTDALIEVFDRFGVSGDISLQHQLFNRFNLGIRYSQDLTAFLSYNYTNPNGNIILGKYSERSMYLNLIARYSL